MATPPPPPPESPRRTWYEGFGPYWSRANRPFTGCGCFYALIVVLIIVGLLSWLFRVPFPFALY